MILAARPLTALTLLGALTLSSVSCGQDLDPPTPRPGQDDLGAPDQRPAPDQGADQATPQDQGPDADLTPPVLAEFGYDERPQNLGCAAGPRPAAQDAQVKLTRRWEQLTLRKPVDMLQPPGQPSIWYIVQQDGQILRLDAASGAWREVLNIQRRIATGGERGLLGLAFHPQWAVNRRAFLSYTYTHPRDGLTSRISEVRVAPDGSLDDRQESSIIEAKQPYNNHNGGQIAFGPDGFLYIAWGDGGSSGDPDNNGQDRQTLLGAILRLDVDGQGQPPAPYLTPPDNPLRGQAGRPELYAWGLRNPWKFSFDAQTGALWSGDVGQNAQEEINLIERGGDYGWNIFEGLLCYRDNPACATRRDVKPPVAVYPHSQGRSVTGGYVYHGQALPGLAGRYLFGDFVSGRLWALRPDAQTGQLAPSVLIQNTGLSISSFGQDQASGEVFVVDYDPQGTRGAGIYALEPAQPPDPAAPQLGPPQKLSQTGCVLPQDPRRKAPGVIPYEPQAPFWSDGATKRRYVALPQGQRIQVRPDGSWELPVGSVLIKDFELGGRLIETRHFVRHDDGVWAGYTYAWDEDGQDATLLATGRRVQRQGQPWIYPDRAECLSCHNSAAGHVLGFERAQLVGLADYPTGRRASQLATLAHVGLLSEVGQGPGLVNPQDPQATLQARARAYLHTNCAYCHLPDGPGRGELDLRWQTPLQDTGACDVRPQLGQLGLPEARIIAPGQPQRSTLLARQGRRDAQGMPPLASTRHDEDGYALLEAWIKDLARCP